MTVPCLCAAQLVQKAVCSKTPRVLSAPCGPCTDADGAPVGARCLAGSTPLHVAARGQAGALHALLEAPNVALDLDARDNEGHTPLELARGRSLECERALLAAGATRPGGGEAAATVAAPSSPRLAAWLRGLLQ